MTVTASPASSPLGRARPTAAIRAARAHTRRVRALRVVLPLLAVAVTGAFFAFIATDPRNALSSHENATALGVRGGTITMEAPHLTGFNANGQTYDVIADRAEQNTKDPGKVALTALTAKVQMRSEGWAHFTAGTGHFDTAQQQLRLGDGVHVATENGDTAALRSAEIDLKGGSVASDKPVEVAFGTAKLRADRMQISDNGDHIVFSGHVAMTLTPQPGTATGGSHP